ncbi:MAG: SIS domain-containing protein [Chloroflexi bacterium]|nr:MAG: SIS domain-containing protein [Chloroflexota bacterium]
MSLVSELAQSPAVVERLVRDARAPLRELAGRVEQRGIDAVFLAARGTSDHAATYAQYVLGIRNGLATGLAVPSVQSVYGAHPDVSRALVIGISQSGRSPDVVEVLADAREQGAVTLAITNEPASPLAEAAETVVALEAGPELAVAASKTYIAELAVVALLSDALAGGGAEAELEALPEHIARALETEQDAQHAARELRGLRQCAVIGRGYHYATIREWALKLKEMALIMSDPYSAADFEHGPIALVEPGYQVLAVAVSGPTLAGLAELLPRLREDGARLLVISDDASVREVAEDAIPLEAGVPEWLSPAVAIVPCQLLAYHLALANGRDPDSPRRLHKVTLTR